MGFDQRGFLGLFFVVVVAISAPIFYRVVILW